MRGPSTSQLNTIASQIRSGLSNVNIPVNIQIPPNQQRVLNSVATDLKKVRRAAAETTDSFELLGKSLSQNIRRYGAFTAATGAFIRLGIAIRQSIGEAIDFETEIRKIAQGQDRTISSYAALRGEIDSLSKSLGVSSLSLASTSRILAQAGLSATEVKDALSALAKSTLAPTFGEINETTEASIAIMRQFGVQANELGAILGSVNKVSADFAVESEDIAAAVKLAGASFAASAPQFQKGEESFRQFIALFTSVRQTTRGSAESIATGLRTITTRLQRSGTIEYFKNLGIQLRDNDGQFIGTYEAIRKISKALEDIPGTDQRFTNIAELLGGYRQIDKTIPLLQQFAVAEKAYQSALKGRESLDKGLGLAQETLAVKFARVREEFNSLVRKISENEGFRAMIGLALKLSSAMIKVVDSITPLLPLISAIGLIKIGVALPKIGRGFAADYKSVVGRKADGGKVHYFNKGGIVPGHGNSDTVPAMLTPGERIIPKKDVKKYINAGGVNNQEENLTPQQIALKKHLDANGGYKKFVESNPGFLQLTKAEQIEAASKTKYKTFAKSIDNFYANSKQIQEAQSIRSDTSIPVEEKTAIIKRIKRRPFNHKVAVINDGVVGAMFATTSQAKDSTVPITIEKENFQFSSPPKKQAKKGKEAKDTKAYEQFQLFKDKDDTVVDQVIFPANYYYANSSFNPDFVEKAKEGFAVSVDSMVDSLINNVGQSPFKPKRVSGNNALREKIIAKIGINDVLGKVFEGVLNSQITISESPKQDENFDFLGDQLHNNRFIKNIFGEGLSDNPPIFLDAKYNANAGAIESLKKKVTNQIGGASQYYKLRTITQKDIYEPRKEGDEGLSNKEIDDYFRIGQKGITGLKGERAFKGTKAGDTPYSPKAFANGGLVPGSGNTDSVPMNLENGQYVIRKKAVEHIGAGNLAKLANGGPANSLVMPGEYVFDKKSAKQIGTSTLGKLNHADKYASGGSVGLQRFDDGGIKETELKAKIRDLESQIAVNNKESADFGSGKGRGLTVGEAGEKLNDLSKVAGQLKSELLATVKELNGMKTSVNEVADTITAARKGLGSGIGTGADVKRIISSSNTKSPPKSVREETKVSDYRAVEQYQDPGESRENPFDVADRLREEAKAAKPTVKPVAPKSKVETEAKRTIRIVKEEEEKRSQSPSARKAAEATKVTSPDTKVQQQQTEHVKESGIQFAILTSLLGQTISQFVGADTKIGQFISKMTGVISTIQGAMIVFGQLKGALGSDFILKAKDLFTGKSKGGFGSLVPGNVAQFFPKFGKGKVAGAAASVAAGVAGVAGDSGVGVGDVADVADIASTASDFLPSKLAKRGSAARKSQVLSRAKGIKAARFAKAARFLGPAALIAAAGAVTSEFGTDAGVDSIQKGKGLSTRAAVASVGGGAVSGAATGAAIGTMIGAALGPLAPFGTAIGAITGALAGATISVINYNKAIAHALDSKFDAKAQAQLAEGKVGGTTLGTLGEIAKKQTKTELGLGSGYNGGAANKSQLSFLDFRNAKDLQNDVGGPSTMDYLKRGYATSLKYSPVAGQVLGLSDSLGLTKSSAWGQNQDERTKEGLAARGYTSDNLSGVAKAISGGDEQAYKKFTAPGETSKKAKAEFKALLAASTGDKSIQANVDKANELTAEFDRSIGDYKKNREKANALVKAQEALAKKMSDTRTALTKYTTLLLNTNTRIDKSEAVGGIAKQRINDAISGETSTPDFSAFLALSKKGEGNRITDNILNSAPAEIRDAAKLEQIAARIGKEVLLERSAKGGDLEQGIEGESNKATSLELSDTFNERFKKAIEESGFNGDKNQIDNQQQKFQQDINNALASGSDVSTEGRQVGKISGGQVQEIITGMQGRAAESTETDFRFNHAVNEATNSITNLSKKMLDINFDSIAKMSANLEQYDATLANVMDLRGETFDKVSATSSNRSIQLGNIASAGGLQGELGPSGNLGFDVQRLIAAKQQAEQTLPGLRAVQQNGDTLNDNGLQEVQKFEAQLATATKGLELFGKGSESVISALEAKASELKQKRDAAGSSALGYLTSDRKGKQQARKDLDFALRLSQGQVSGRDFSNNAGGVQAAKTLFGEKEASKMFAKIPGLEGLFKPNPEEEKIHQELMLNNSLRKIANDELSKNTVTITELNKSMILLRESLDVLRDNGPKQFQQDKGPDKKVIEHGGKFQHEISLNIKGLETNMATREEVKKMLETGINAWWQQQMQTPNNAVPFGVEHQKGNK